MTSASAPGKIILFGEHAVVYGRPALAAPVTQVHADVEVSDSTRAGIWIHAPRVDLHAELNSLPSDHPIASVIHKFLFLSRVSPSPLTPILLEEGKFPHLTITITSTIPVASGLGSGAAVTVALLRALSHHLNHPMTDEEVNAFAFEIEKLHHGTPSGIDNTVVTYAKPVYFVKGQPIEIFRAARPFTIVIGDTGILAPTKESVGDVRKLWETDKARWEKVFDEVGKLAEEARAHIERGKTKELGELMNRNHALLQEMTVSSPELDRLVEAARTAGALGAKLSGGGRGGNMIALVEPDLAEAVSRSLKEAGAKGAIVTAIE
ncbi:MAG: mevalonate kinase [Chloroflexota bacterium]